MHERLLTNMERLKMGMTTEGKCSICNDYEETTLHMLRDCMEARMIWLQFIEYCYWDNFFSMSLNDWLLVNLRSEDMCSKTGTLWNLAFGTICWILWNWRNRTLFEDEFLKVTY